MGIAPCRYVVADRTGGSSLMTPLPGAKPATKPGAAMEAVLLVIKPVCNLEPDNGCRDWTGMMSRVFFVLLPTAWPGRCAQFGGDANETVFEQTYFKRLTKGLLLTSPAMVSARADATIGITGRVDDVIKRVPWHRMGRQRWKTPLWHIPKVAEARGCRFRTVNIKVRHLLLHYPDERCESPSD